MCFTNNTTSFPLKRQVKQHLPSWLNIDEGGERSYAAVFSWESDCSCVSSEDISSLLSADVRALGRSPFQGKIKERGENKQESQDFPPRVMEKSLHKVDETDADVQVRPDNFEDHLQISTGKSFTAAQTIPQNPQNINTADI